MQSLTAWATQRSVELEGLTVAPLSLEDVYLKLTGEADALAGEADALAGEADNAEPVEDNE